MDGMMMKGVVGAVVEGAAAAAAPAWLEGLISGESNFFGGCGVHVSWRKNEMNMFCLHCCVTLCPHCLPSHSSSHPLLQIRRYVYHHVVRLHDLHNFIDSSNIQPYTINGAKVIFLNHRPQSRPPNSKPPSNVCLTCHRILQQPFHFCSLSCKVDHMLFEGADLSTILFSFDDQSDFGFSGLMANMDDINIIGSSRSSSSSEHTHHHPHQIITPYYSISSSNDQATTNSNNNNNGAASFLPPGIHVLSLGSRRKGTAPQRAPLS